MEAPGLLTISRPALAEFTEKKSRFIGQLFPVDSEDRAKEILEQIRGQHKGARHHVYAWVIGQQDQYTRSSDDGEPAGTGGRPVLESIKQANLHNAALIVTRYFGGVLLGAGGLTRAYAKAAQLAIAAADKVYRVPAGGFALTVDYAFLAKAESLLAAAGAQVKEKIFGENVCLLCVAPLSALPLLRQQLTELGNGAPRLDELGEDAYLERPAP